MQENKLFLKTEFVIMVHTNGLSGSRESISLSCDGSSSTKSESLKYLGVVIDEHLSFNKHIEHVVKKVSGNSVFLGD